MSKTAALTALLLWLVMVVPLSDHRSYLTIFPTSVRIMVVRHTRLSLRLALSINFVDMFGVIGTVNIAQNLNPNP